jgi:hypothetical protein
MSNRLGIAAAILTPLQLMMEGAWFAASLPAGSARYIWFTSPEPVAFYYWLYLLEFVPGIASLFGIIAMLSVLCVRGTCHSLWSAMTARGPRFWFVATLSLSLLPSFHYSLVLIHTFGVSSRAVGASATIWPFCVSTFMQVWLAHAWVRWMFLPYVVSGPDEDPAYDNVDC